MNNKSLLAIIAAQSAVMLGLLYTLWEQISNDLLINENTAIILAAFSGAALVLGFAFQTQKTPTYEAGVQSEIRQAGFRFLNLGDRVEFEVGSGKKGPVALKVIRTKPADSETVPNNYEEPEESPLTQQVTETQLN